MNVGIYNSVNRDLGFKFIQMKIGKHCLQILFDNTK